LRSSATIAFSTKSLLLMKCESRVGVRHVSEALFSVIFRQPTLCGFGL